MIHHRALSPFSTTVDDNEEIEAINPAKRIKAKLSGRRRRSHSHTQRVLAYLKENEAPSPDTNALSADDISLEVGIPQQNNVQFPRRTESSADFFEETNLYRTSKEFRVLGKTHSIGSSEAGDLKFLSSLKTLTKKKRDNLLMASSSYLLDSIFLNPSSQPKLTEKIDLEWAITESQLGFTGEQLEKALPVPPSSIFIAHNETSSSPASEGSSEETLDPEVIGLLMSNYFSSKSDPVALRQYSKYAMQATPDSIANHQARAAALFADVIYSGKSTMRSRKTSEKAKGAMSEYQFKRVSDRKDLQIGQTVPLLSLSSHVFNFNSLEEPVKKDSPATEELILKNSSKTNVEFTIPEVVTNSYTIKAQPSHGEVKKKEQVKVNLVLTSKSSLIMDIKELLTVEVKGGPRYFVKIQAECDIRQFGIDHNSLQHVEVANIGRIPALLVHMRRCLEDHGGLLQQGVFRESGSDRKIQEFKRYFNRGDYRDCADIHVIANLIKAWFRELPVSLFDTIPAKTFQQLDPANVSKCQALIDGLPEDAKTLFTWVLDLMCATEEHKGVNKMNAGNLAIVFAPNLFIHKDPLMMLSLTNKVTKMVEALINLEIQNRIHKSAETSKPSTAAEPSIESPM